MKKVLFISVHPDDETLGCGGTILKHKSKGDKIHWLIITSPTLNHPYGFSEQIIKKRKDEIHNVTNAFGFDDVTCLEFPTQLLDEISTRELVSKIGSAINQISPNIIYTINRSDVHSDHRVAFQAIYACTKSFRQEFIEKILMYETISETDNVPALHENSFMPNVFVDISNFFAKKIEIMKIYESELMEGNLPRSISAITSLAGYRGSRLGTKYAEAFVLLFSKE